MRVHVLIVIVASAVVVLCGGCGSGKSSSASDPTAAFPGVHTADQCSAGYTNVPLTPETNYEQWLAPSLRLCFEQLATSTYGTPQVTLEVINAGPAVWVLDGVESWNAQARTTGPNDVVVFRNAPQGISGLAVEPGQKGYPTVPDTFSPHLHLDTALQAEWEAISRSVHAIERRAKQALLNRFSPSWKAATICGLAGYSAAKDFDSAQTIPPDQLLPTVFSHVRAAQECQQEIEKAQQAAEREYQPIPLKISDFEVSVAETRSISFELENSSLVSATKLARFVTHVK